MMVLACGQFSRMRTHPGLSIFQEVHVRTLPQALSTHPPTSIQYADYNLIKSPKKARYHNGPNDRRLPLQNFDYDFHSE
jgi:hypothetical protein